MEMTEIKLRDEYIKLGQALKAAGIAESAVDAKCKILEGQVLVNGEKEFQRGKKLFEGDEVICEEIMIKITR